MCDTLRLTGFPLGPGRGRGSASRGIRSETDLHRTSCVFECDEPPRSACLRQALGTPASSSGSSWIMKSEIFRYVARLLILDEQQGQDGNVTAQSWFLLILTLAGDRSLRISSELQHNLNSFVYCASNHPHDGFSRIFSCSQITSESYI